MLNIVIICYVPEARAGSGGITLKTIELSYALSAEGYRVNLIFIKRMGYHPYIPIKKLNCTVIREVNPVSICNRINSYKPDIVICEYSTYTGLAGALAKHFLNVPVIIIIHGAGIRFYSHGRLTRKLLILLPKLLLRTDVHLITVCESLKRELIRLGIRRKRIDVIPNWVNTERFKPIKTNKIYDLIFAGSLYAEKQLPLLFDAHKYLSSQTKGLGCTPSIMILGDGPMRSAWEQHEYVKKLNINFVGWQQNISTWYNKSRIFVLPSKIEGMPSALLEAMACALPPVATAVGGIPEVIQNHKNGLLVPPANHKLLAENIVELLENDRLRVELGTHARSTVLRKFDIDKIIPRYIDVFNKL